MRAGRKYRRLAAVFLCALVCALAGCGGNGYQSRVDRGLTALRRGEYERAIEFFDEAIARDDTRPDAYRARGDAYLALADGASRAWRQERRESAAADYEAAIQRDRNSADTRKKLIALYLLMGDEAAETAERAANAMEEYAAAGRYYEAALALDRANADAYGRLADVQLAQSLTEQAAATLEKGVNACHDVTLERRLEQVREVLSRQAEAARQAVAVRALEGVPYFGSTALCAMTPEQALAYARLLADGVNGKFAGFSGYGRPLFDGNVYWDEPYAVIGYGSYETDRANVLLADFAGDGNPYLYIFSSVVDRNSFEIYGWDGGQVKLVTGIESYGGQQEGILTGTGTILLEVSEATGERSWSGQVYRFSDAGLVVSRVWDAVWDPTAENMRVTTNGVPERMSEAAWNRLREAVPSTELNRAGSCSLREMIGWLNAYASALGGDAGGLVEIPPEHPDRHQMATAMLRQLFALDQRSVQSEGTRLSDTRLLDLDGDGQEELLAAFQGNYEAEDETTCQFALYRWRNGALEEIPGGTGYQELHLVRYGDETGVLGAGRLPQTILTASDSLLAMETGQTVATVYSWTFLSHSEAVRVEERLDGNRYYVVKNGVPVAIAESEFNAIREKYEELEPIVNYRTPVQNRNYSNTVAALYQIRRDAD